MRHLIVCSRADNDPEGIGTTDKICSIRREGEHEYDETQDVTDGQDTMSESINLH